MKLLSKLDLSELGNKANQIRKDVVEVCVKNGAGHIAPSLSCIDILTILYYYKMDLYESPMFPERDRLVFSKAHGCYGLYAILADRGFLNRNDWTNFYRGSFLSGCIERSVEYGIEAGCGALGHGLPMAVGMAFGAKLQKHDYKTYCIIGDGEFQEGSNWEAIQFASKHSLNNLSVVVDCNRLQAMDFIENVLSTRDVISELNEKLQAFGFGTVVCDGHDFASLDYAFSKSIQFSQKTEKPHAILCRTTKGYGLKCMENVPKFHFRLPTEEELLMGNRYDEQ